ncbi:MAG: preprotein translocase subunit SecG [Gallionellales bacterium RBG_16_56_9]|nr:MAG: preprotein translocase subunit SecG [Gallionellales bacterium RBG_16_56_9]
MNYLFSAIVVIQVISALAIIVLVLLQHGKGADMGAAFGSGASGSLFGASGSSNFLSKFTAAAAAVFFIATLALAFYGGRHTSAGGGVMENLPAAPAPVNSDVKSIPAPADAAPASTAKPSAPIAPADQSSQIPK